MYPYTLAFVRDMMTVLIFTEQGLFYAYAG